MKEFFEYRENTYFNENEPFLMWDEGINRFTVSYLKHGNGFWYNISGLSFKVHSIKTVKLSEIKGKSFVVEGYSGKVCKYLVDYNNLGIVWDNQQKKLPVFWQDINVLKNIKL